MIVIHTDASTKNGYSSWVYKSSVRGRFHAGIIQTRNTAAMEMLAIIKGIQSAPKGEKVLIITDSRAAAVVIQQFGQKYIYSNISKDYYKETRAQLIHTLYSRDVDAIWVGSNNRNTVHLAVDKMSKIVLDCYLRGVE